MKSNEEAPMTIILPPVKYRGEKDFRTFDILSDGEPMVRIEAMASEIDEDHSHVQLCLMGYKSLKDIGVTPVEYLSAFVQTVDASNYKED